MTRVPQAPTPGAPRPSPADQVELARRDVQALVEAQDNERLRELWQGDWESRFEQLQEFAARRPEIPISLVGSVGSGKSTLLNALLGARLLPVSNMRACTAAICEVGFAEGPYHARVEFISREVWQQEIGLLLEEARELRHQDDNDPSPDPRTEMTVAVRDKLWAVYRPTPTPQDLADLQGCVLDEPPEVRDALDAGFIEFSHAELRPFHRQLAQYLDSTHRFWPLVKRVVVQGPFEHLRGGIRIIDLPGLNDPNPAREEVTLRHLKTCRFVWIVFNCKRALTNDLVTLMRTDDFFRQLVMDGRAEALTFVGTAADDFDPEAACEELQLPGDADTASIIAARNNAVRREVRQQLTDLALELAQTAGEPHERGKQLADLLSRSPVVTVSAKEFARLRGITRSNPAGMADTRQTEILELLEMMRQFADQLGVPDHERQIRRQQSVILEEVRCEVQSQQAALRQRAEVSEQQRREMEAAASAARSFLDEALQEAAERLVMALAERQAALAERLMRAVERGERELHQTLLRWEQTHHGTILAVCRREGAYVGPKGLRDFPAELAKPVLDSIAFAWSDFFGNRLQEMLGDRVLRIVEVANDYRQRMLDGFAAGAPLPPDLRESIDNVFATTERVLRERLGQATAGLEAHLVEVQRGLYEAVPGQIKSDMAPAFAEAAQQRGKGMKQRMLQIIRRRAEAVSSTMFRDARETLLAGVRELSDWLRGKYDEMIAAVGRNAALAAKNLEVSGDRLSAQGLAEEQARVDALLRAVESLLRRYAA